jgi:hypothetical protein
MQVTLCIASPPIFSSWLPRTHVQSLRTCHTSESTSCIWFDCSPML